MKNDDMSSEYIATEVPASQLAVGDLVLGDDGDFRGGTLVKKGPHPYFHGELSLTFQATVHSNQQGALTVTDARVASPNLVVTVARPI
jgi:hypothetical protein